MLIEYLKYVVPFVFGFCIAILLLRFKAISEGIKWLFLMMVHTFDSSDSGFSWRKIAGLAGLVTAVFLTIEHVETVTYLSTLYAWQVFVGVCLGFVTIAQVTELVTRKESKDKQS